MKVSNKITLNLEDIKKTFIKFFSDKRRLGKTILILLILIIALGIRLLNLNKEQEKVVMTDGVSSNKQSMEMYVDISGEVNKPGVYLVNDGTRLYEVIEKAGGLTDNANTDQINQAGYVEDGEKIVIPSLNDEVVKNTDVQPGTFNSNSGLININTASKDQLMEITGVGEVIAERIIDYRKNNRFKSIEDIMNVNGIGNATYDKMKSQITV